MLELIRYKKRIRKASKKIAVDGPCTRSICHDELFTVRKIFRRPASGIHGTKGLQNVPRLVLAPRSPCSPGRPGDTRSCPPLLLRLLLFHVSEMISCELARTLKGRQNRRISCGGDNICGSRERFAVDSGPSLQLPTHLPAAPAGPPALQHWTGSMSVQRWPRITIGMLLVENSCPTNRANSLSNGEVRARTWYMKFRNFPEYSRYSWSIRRVGWKITGCLISGFLSRTRLIDAKQESSG